MFQLMVNWWFGIPVWKGLLLWGTLGSQTTRPQTTNLPLASISTHEPWICQRKNQIPCLGKIAFGGPVLGKFDKMIVFRKPNRTVWRILFHGPLHGEVRFEICDFFVFILKIQFQNCHDSTIFVAGKLGIFWSNKQHPCPNLSYLWGGATSFKWGPKSHIRNVWFRRNTPPVFSIFATRHFQIPPKKRYKNHLLVKNKNYLISPDHKNGHFWWGAFTWRIIPVSRWFGSPPFASDKKI